MLDTWIPEYAHIVRQARPALDQRAGRAYHISMAMGNSRDEIVKTLISDATDEYSGAWTCVVPEEGRSLGTILSEILEDAVDLLIEEGKIVL